MALSPRRRSALVLASAVASAPLWFAAAAYAADQVVTFSGVPAHPFDSGVIRYTTVPVDTASALESTCPMTFPEPAAAPLTLVLL